MTSLNIYLKTGFLSIALIFIASQISNSQAPLLMRSVLGSGGKSVSVYSDGARISFPQSIGQYGMTGVYNKKNIELRQGFIQPVMITRTGNETENLKVSIYPNPFSSEVYVRMNKTVTGNIELRINDIAGKLVYSKKISAMETILIDLSFLYRGIYILCIKSDSILTNYKIIKN